MRIGRGIAAAALAALLGFGAAAAPQAARPPLSQAEEINAGLLAVGLADEIRKKCPRIEARMLHALGYLAELKARARALGYSEEEIEDYVTSKAEKARMRALGRAWLAQRGVTGEDPEAYCALGQREIAAGSAIGRLLRVK